MPVSAIKPHIDLVSQQINLEQEMRNMGVDRFRAAIKSAQEQGVEDLTVYGNSIIDASIKPVADELRALLAERAAGKAGRKGPAHKRLLPLLDDIEAVAYIAVRVLVSSISKPDTPMSTLAAKLGRAVEDEARYLAVKEQDAAFYKRLAEEAKKRSAPHVKRKVVNLFINRREMDLPPEWEQRERTFVGQVLIEAVIKATGLFEKKQVILGAKDTVIYIAPTEATLTFIKDRVAAVEVLRPLYEPMIIPPVDWTAPMVGGYLTRSARPLRVVKTGNKDYIRSLEEIDLTQVYASVNAAQRTAWAINPFILSVLDLAWEKDYSLGGVPSLYDTPMPPKPADIDTNEEARAEWRKAAHAVFLENLEMNSKRTAFTSALNTATRYSLFPAIYFPYQCDFRGRLYAVPQLNPQGPDWMKALLHFAEAKPLDEDSAPFLAIHLANCGAFGKIDKAPLEDRVAWVYENEERILACADDPFENRWWTEADSPYCFLAVCHEWAGWVREGVGFMSRIPVALDGSCSGIQHFSMALADEVGGAAVNLVPADKPSDIYTLVMNEAVKQVQADAAGEGEEAELAAAWLRSGLLTRSCFKRPTMTYGYGSNQFGFREQILIDTLRPAYKEYQRGQGPWFFEDNGFKASVYLSKVTMAAVERVVVKAAEAMAWLKEVARVVTAEGLPVRWTTPDGFPVVQMYREVQSDRIDTVIFGSRIRLTVRSETDKVDRRKQASGFSPNFVHSLDATHLRLTVLRAAEEGITDFALVHDSFGTHAANTGRFFALLRETLVELYTSTDVMRDLYEEVSGHLSPEKQALLPPPPARGTLDLNAVVDCDFAFA